MDYMLQPPEDPRAQGIEEMVHDWSDERLINEAIKRDIWNPADEDMHGNAIPRPPLAQLREEIVDQMIWEDDDYVYGED